MDELGLLEFYSILLLGATHILGLGHNITPTLSQLHDKGGGGKYVITLSITYPFAPFYGAFM